MLAALRAFAPLMLAGLAACALTPPETSRTVDAEPATVVAQVEEALARLGLPAATRVDGDRVRADLPHVRREWASCAPTLVGDSDDGRRVATASRIRGEVEVRLAPAANGTQVTVDTRYVGSYRDTVNGYSFDRPCRTTGALEERLLAGAAG